MIHDPRWMTGPAEHFALFDSSTGSAILLSDYQGSLDFDGTGDLPGFFAQIESKAQEGQWLALAADYALGSSFESAMVCGKSGQPLLRAWVFARSETLTADEVKAFLATRLKDLPEAERTAGVALLSPSLELEPYCQAVTQIRQWIRDGDCYQINFTFPLDFQIYGHPLALYARLRERQPVRYGGYLATPEETLLSLSPELFFERCGSRVRTRPMKGTAARGATPAADAAAREALLASTKERAENIMIVDLLRNDLGRLAAPGGVRVEALCEAEAYPGLWQMVSSISADLPGSGLFDIFRALFPCGSITGAPKIQAMRRINELESRARGRYTGALGWLAPNGDCRFNVAIRTIEAGKGGRAKMGVGSGIVIDSEPVREYAECLLKAGFLTGLDPGFELIETLRLASGVYPLLNLHRDRLAASAKSLGFALDLPAVSALLAGEATRHPKGTHRVRLSLAHAGSLHLVSTPMPADDGRPWQVVLSTETLNPDEFLLRHKTTARSRYDRTLESLAGQPQVFDAIFLNTRGEVCEGARSNVFIERDGLLLTPPLTCGLLPGVMRQSLLDSGRAREHVLNQSDLWSAPQLYMANALRGLLPVKLAI